MITLRQITAMGLILAVLCLYGCAPEYQPLKIAQIFGDNMVLQAKKPINVWGTATPGMKVQVGFRSQQVSAKTNEQGEWKAVLEAEDYGKGDTLLIIARTDTILFQNVLVGEVWLCSGQSNMEMPLISNWARLNNAKEEVANANYPDIRLFTVKKSINFAPVDTFETTGWMACDSSSVKDFSATAYFFGRELSKKLNVPIGLIHSSWGGTVAEAWTSEEALLNMPDFAEEAKRINSMGASLDSLIKKYDRDVAQMQKEIKAADIGYKGDTILFADPELDDSDWMPFNLPKMWEETSMGNFDGSVWFRKDIEISEELAATKLQLCFGAVDDWDEAWVNGVKVGANKAWGLKRKYDIPDSIVKVGTNNITIRIYDHGGGGGFMNEAKDYFILSDSTTKISIAQGWMAKKGFDFKDIKTKPISLVDPNQPTVLYNGMIYPLVPFTIRGAIWYQGESNAGRAYQYRELFKTMITDWRKQFDQGDFPFYFVQLASYLPRNSEPVEDTWAELREAQTMALELSNTGMAVAIDIGDALDIHPGNKQDVGKRLALNALAKTYEQDIDYMGPLYKSYEVVDNTIALSFKFDEGLQTQDGAALTGFSIAGADSTFVWADAKIEGNKVVVSNSKVSNPIAVRYAWSSNPACNLTNKSGLPASPFRTDSFKGITE